MTAIWVALIGAWATVMVSWLDTRKRTNGEGPLAKKIDLLGDRLAWIELRVHSLEDEVKR